MSQSHPNQALQRQSAGGLLWALFFVLAPMEVLVFGALVWIPLLIWRERVRAARYGFWPGMVARLGIVAVAIAIAVIAPTKHEDGRVGPLLRTDLTLGEMAAAGVINPPFDRQHDSVRVSLPSVKPTRREVIQAITQQTGFRASIFHCGNGATILFGGGGGRIRVADTDIQAQTRTTL
jgi:hypothetical protein